LKDISIPASPTSDFSVLKNVQTITAKLRRSN